MDTRNGDIYPSVGAALESGVPENRLVTGTDEALQNLKRRFFEAEQKRNRGHKKIRSKSEAKRRKIQHAAAKKARKAQR